MIWLSVASLRSYPASQHEQVTKWRRKRQEKLAASGKVIKSMGWKEVYEGADDDLEDEADDEKTERPASSGDEN